MILFKHIILSSFLIFGFSNTNCQNDTINNENNASLYFYRKRQFVGSGGGIGIEINKKQINKLKNASRLIVELNDLNSLVQIESYNKLISPTDNSVLRFTPKIGNDYYIEVSLDTGMRFILKDEKTGKEEFNYRLFYNHSKEPIESIKISAEINETNEYKIQPQDTITYRSKNKLEWEDFKMTPNKKDVNKGYHLNVTIATFPKKVNVWTGIIKVECFAGVGRDFSWVKSESKNSTLLSYVQLKYDIANYYAKLAENEINRNKINAGNTKYLREIIDLQIEKMKATFVKMDEESNYGTNENIIANWKNNINELLEK